MNVGKYRPLGWAAYGVAVLLIFFPLLDSLLGVWPLRVEDVTWRFGAVGLFSRAVMTPALGLLLGIGTAVLFEHRKRIRAFSILSLLGGVIALFATGIFTLDALEARAQIVPEAASAFDIAAVAAVAKYLIGAALCTLLGVGGWIAGKPRSGDNPNDRRSSGSDALVARSSRE